MLEATQRVIVQAVRDHPAVVGAAITGSLARGNDVDSFSDLDLLLVASDTKAVRDVRAWLPDPAQVLLHAFHRSDYCTVLLDTFEKIDIAIFAAEDAPTRWVVLNYEVVKGGEEFQAQLASAARATRESAAAHLNPDVSLDNVLLLLVTASSRIARGEMLSAQSFLAMACDMAIALETHLHGVDDAADLLDPRRRLERRRPALASVIHRCLFGPPNDGVTRLTQHVSSMPSLTLTGPQRRVLNHLDRVQRGQKNGCGHPADRHR